MSIDNNLGELLFRFIRLHSGFRADNNNNFMRSNQLNESDVKTLLFKENANLMIVIKFKYFVCNQRLK